MLHARGITKRFGPQTVLENVDWHVGRGARVGLVGPNGAGKTTLLRILAGIDAPDAGEVTLPKGALVGYLPQEVETLEGSTVLGQALVGFREVREAEEEIERIEGALAARPAPDQLERLTRRYGDLRQRFEALGGYRLEGEAQAILGGLGFKTSSMHAPLTELSGGWRMRAALAGHLLREPNLLLLDEPTNHLDLESLAWLEDFLEEYEGSIVIVSHDRFFLNRVVDEIAEVEGAALTVYTGDYDDYVEEKEARREALLAAKKQQDREIEATQRFIDRFRYKKTKARQVQSRIKRLDKIERIKIHRGPKGVRFDFPQPSRSGAETIRAEAIRKAYGANVVYEAVDFVARRGERIALVGPNGAGKTTLLKILAGTLEPDSGRRILGHNVSLHYYAQHQLEALDGSRTVLEELESTAPDSMRPRLRTLLGAFLFTGDDIDKKVAVLSGGEKARLALAKMLMKPASLLLLDEPTNHLDLRSRGVLEEALDEYTGTIVFISHDRYFINRIGTMIAYVNHGTIDVREESYDEFMERLRAEAQAARQPAVSDRPGGAVTSTSASKGAAASGSGSRGVAGSTSRSRRAAASGSPQPARDDGGVVDSVPESERKNIRAAYEPGFKGPEAPEGAHAAQSGPGPMTSSETEPQGERDSDVHGSRRKSREEKRQEAEERQRRHQETRGFKERLAAVEKEIASLESRMKEVEAALSDPALYRDGERARTVKHEHREIQERIAWLYDEWSHLEETLDRL